MPLSAYLSLLAGPPVPKPVPSCTAQTERACLEIDDDTECAWCARPASGNIRALTSCVLRQAAQYLPNNARVCKYDDDDDNDNNNNNNNNNNSNNNNDDDSDDDNDNDNDDDGDD